VKNVGEFSGPSGIAARFLFPTHEKGGIAMLHLPKDSTSRRRKSRRRDSRSPLARLRPVAVPARRPTARLADKSPISALSDKPSGASLEGFLFPDTYLFLPNAKPSDVLAVFEENFNVKIKSIDDAIRAFKKPLKDIVIMASILEAEARTTETRRIIAGILWKRLSIGMPLQVDAPFQYIIGKNTFQLTTGDLKFDSPYNTYLYKGLPPGAIGNPGLDAILATTYPQGNDYLYFLTTDDGVAIYGRNFEEHKANKARYLN